MVRLKNLTRRGLRCPKHSVLYICHYMNDLHFHSLETAAHKNLLLFATNVAQLSFIFVFYICRIVATASDKYNMCKYTGNMLTTSNLANYFSQSFKWPTDVTTGNRDSWQSHLELDQLNLINFHLMTIYINSSPPSAAYMRQWIGSVFVWHQPITWTNAGLLSIGRTPENKFQWNFNSIIFIQENAFEMLSAKLAVILSRGRWVKETHELFDSLIFRED